ncbi:MAG: hypothetical protein EOP83_05945 [Verrucomicrobiaceae bacterium]|nr:MAG: hypothetical protein EOP83_05945 [Verrucomicrobiaceae bacterium]
MNKKFHDIFEATRYLQAQEGEHITSIGTLSRALDLSVDEIAEAIETVGETLVGIVRAGRTITGLFIRVQ